MHPHRIPSSSYRERWMVSAKASNSLLDSVTLIFDNLAAPWVWAFCGSSLERWRQEFTDPSLTRWNFADKDSTTCKNNVINNNRFIDMMTRLHDNGAVYTLGQMQGTVINQNYVRGIPNNTRWTTTG